MGFKFKVEQAVKYIGRNNRWSPPFGTIGYISTVSPIGIDYQVQFPEGSIKYLNYFPQGYNFWYGEDELEAVDDGREEERINAKVQYPERAWAGC